MDKRKEQVLALLGTLEGATFKERSKIAKEFGVELPLPEVSEQLSAAYVKSNHVPEGAKEGTIGKDYAIIPSLKLADGSTTRALWVRLDIARAVGERLVALANNAGR